jgi:cytochrome c556
MANKFFDEEFRAAYAKLEVDARAAGMTISAVCQASGVGRALPARWKNPACVPETVAKLTAMQQAVERQLAINKSSAKAK